MIKLKQSNSTVIVSKEQLEEHIEECQKILSRYRIHQQQQLSTVTTMQEEQSLCEY
ncbi:hypothetical protein [Xenorhabdus kozodoii]|uniref:Uncharacterized protein n=1 Tax=Xenorhabdus kozodoii TaxID=351676 RepID=A0A2D0KY64_9GAMM|nr:hypothetical protein [Xenorhabdus kozodoii]PHM68389.1 hypothetical protein Xkoz_03690 [Xenorhabdus kozodoii]